MALNMMQRKRVMMKQSLEMRKLSGGEDRTTLARLLNRKAIRKFTAYSTGALKSIDFCYTAFT